MSYINIDAAIAEAKAALDARDKSLRRVDVVRNDLRNALEFGEPTQEQASWITETFPVRHRRTPEERAAALASQAEQAKRVVAERQKAASAPAKKAQEAAVS